MPKKEQSHISAWHQSGVHCEIHKVLPGAAPGLPAHAHAEYQIGLTLNYRKQYGYRGTRHIAHPGSISIFHPGEVHTASTFHDFHPGLTFRTMFVPAAVFQDVQDTRHSATPLPFFAEPILCDPLLFQRFVLLHRALERPASQLEADGLLMSALWQLRAGHADQQRELREAGRERAAIRRALDYLQDNYAENVSLDSLAGIAGLSVFHFARVFRQETGLPDAGLRLIGMRRQARVWQARRMLAQGVPIADAAQSVGFFDQSHLHQHFKRLIGVTPGRYAALKTAR